MSNGSPTVNERLASVEAILSRVEKGFTNHLKHHWATDLVLLTALLGLVVKLLTSK